MVVSSVQAPCLGLRTLISEIELPAAEYISVDFGKKRKYRK
jgi:hypothetical protein